MRRKRERLDVIHDILVAIRDRRRPVRSTHVLYASNLSSQMLKEYLADLMDKQLVRETEASGKPAYELTEKAFRYLQDYEQVKAFLESYGLD